MAKKNIIKNNWSYIYDPLNGSDHEINRRDFLKKHYKNMSLDKKIIIAKTNIKDFLLIIKKTDKKLPLISFSGGKDSCVLRHLVHEVQNELGYKKMCNSITAFEIFNPFTFEFIKNNKQNGDRILPPFKNFAWILKNAGYPIISKQLAQKISHIRNTKNHRTYIRATFGLDNKNFSNLPLQYCHFLDKKLITYKISHKCCDYMKGPVKHNSIPMFVGTTISESRLRRNSWLKYGCNYFGKKKSICRPISLWTEKDIWEYIAINDISVSPIYGYKKNPDNLSKYSLAGYKRSGCLVCMFGLSLEQEICRTDSAFRNRFELLHDTNFKIFHSYVLSKPYELWKPLTDMNVKLRINNSEYIRKYNKRHVKIINWYRNFDTNFKNVLNEIEKRNPGVWTRSEKLSIFNKYKKSQQFYLKR